MTTWSAVDEPLLRWLLAREADDGWNGRIEELALRPEPVARAEFGPGLDSRQVDAGLQRLRDHGLIEGERMETVSYAHWSVLRVRAGGLILLGEWPDLERVASFTGLQALIAALADRANDPEDQSALRHTAGAVGRLGEGIVEQTIGSIGTDVAGGL